MRAIHLIARAGLNVSPVAGTTNDWESGDWVIGKKTAPLLVGAEIYLHDKQSARSYRGGTIVSYRRLTAGNVAGRVVLRFRNKPGNVGIPAPPNQNWGQEKMLVR